MAIAHESAFITPTQGFLGGIGIALSTALLLFSTGRTFGVSGFIHRSSRPSPTATSNSRRGDIIGFIGLLLGGLCVGALEANTSNLAGYHRPQGGADSRGAASASAITEVATVALAGLLSGLGSRMQNGCTSGHMVCGLSRFSRRSIIATLVFIPVASLTAQFQRGSLRPIEGYDWSLSPIGSSILQIEVFTFKIAIVLLLIVFNKNIGLLSNGTKNFFNGVISLLSAFAFALALRLSTLSSPTKVLSFLITPIPEPRVFDSTLAFLAMGAVPLGAILWRLGNRLHAKPWPSQTPSELDAKLNSAHSNGTETQPLITPTPTSSPPRGRLPVLDDVWPDSTNSTVDARLITGSILFGIGWGMLGVCPGPAIINFGTSLYASRRGEIDRGLVRGGTWLTTFVVGGLIAG